MIIANERDLIKHKVNLKILEILILENALQT